MKNTKNGSKNVTKTLMLGAALVTLSSEKIMADTFTDVGLMSASIVLPLLATSTQPLVFGRVVADTAATGTVSIDSVGAQTLGTVVSAAGGLTASISQGVLNITGNASTPVTVALTLPGGGGTSDTVTETAGAVATMVVDSFSVNGAGAGDISEVVTLDVAGAAVVPVGARLNVGVSQTPGLYQGNYTVTVNY